MWLNCVFPKRISSGPSVGADRVLTDNRSGIRRIAEIQRSSGGSRSEPGIPVTRANRVVSSSHQVILSPTACELYTALSAKRCRDIASGPFFRIQIVVVLRQWPLQTWASGNPARFRATWQTCNWRGSSGRFAYRRRTFT